MLRLFGRSPSMQLSAKTVQTGYQESLKTGMQNTELTAEVQAAFATAGEDIGRQLAELADRVRLARGADALSVADVQQARNLLVSRRANRTSSGLGDFGGVFAGYGFGNFLNWAIGLAHPLNATAALVSVLLAVIGAILRVHGSRNS